MCACGRDQAAGRASVIAYADSFGGGGAGGTLPYYVAAACDKVGDQASLLCSRPDRECTMLHPGQCARLGGHAHLLQPQLLRHTSVRITADDHSPT